MQHFLGLLYCVFALFISCKAPNSQGVRQSSTSAVFDKEGNRLEDVNGAKSPDANWKILDPSGESLQMFGGIGLINRCTGFLIDTGVRSAEKSYLLTNGHCIVNDKLIPDEIVTAPDARTSQPVTIKFFRFVEFDMDYMPPANVTSLISDAKLKYGTMKDKDLAIFEIADSPQNLIAHGLHFFKVVDSTKVAVDSQLFLVGLPSVRGNQWLRQSTCQRLSPEFVDAIKENNYIFKNVLPHKCSTLGGASGSPLMIQTPNKDDYEVIAINSTGPRTSPNPTACTENNPCEKDRNGQWGVLGTTNYAQSLDGINLCFDSSGSFALNQQGCPLPKP